MTSQLRRGELAHLEGTIVNRLIDEVAEMDRLDLLRLSEKGNRLFIDKFVPTKYREWWRSISNEPYKSLIRRRVWEKVVAHFEHKSTKRRAK